MSVCPHERWTGYHYILHVQVLLQANNTLQFGFKSENINGHFMWIRFWGYLGRNALHIYRREKRFQQTLERKIKRTSKFYTQATYSVSIAELELIKGKESIMLWLLYDRSKSLFKKWNSAIHFRISNIHAKCFGYNDLLAVRSVQASIFVLYQFCHDGITRSERVTKS